MPGGAGREAGEGRARPAPSRPVAFRLVPFPRPASVPRRAQPDPAPREAPLLLRRPRGAAGMGGASILPPHWAIARGTPRPHSTCTRWSGRGAGRGWGARGFESRPRPEKGCAQTRGGISLFPLSLRKSCVPHTKRRSPSH